MKTYNQILSTALKHQLKIKLPYFCDKLAHWPSGRVFPNGLGDWGLILGQVVSKTQKMVLGAALLNTQHYKVHFKGKVEQSRERSRVLPYTSV